MKKEILIVLLFTFLAQCYSQVSIEFPKEEIKSKVKDSLMKRESICELKQQLGGIIDSKTFEGVRNAAYGYSYIVPKEFRYYFK